MDVLQGKVTAHFPQPLPGPEALIDQQHVLKARGSKALRIPDFEGHSAYCNTIFHNTVLYPYLPHFGALAKSSCSLYSYEIPHRS